jgi:branched-chain amino acid transport system permease protein
VLADLSSLLSAGLVSGCLYALGAIGIVLIFKSSKVVNFAHGNIAGLAAFMVFGLTSGTIAHLSWISAVAVTLGSIICVAALAYLMIAPLVFRSDVTATIATLGIGLMLQGVTQIVFGSDIVALELPLPKWSTSVAGLRITSYDLSVVGITALTIALLHIIIERTRIGIAFRAVSANPFASKVNGLSLRSTHVFSWVIAAILGLIASLLIVPTTFLSSTTVSSFMLQAFVAAVIGGFSSLPGAVVGGILVGVFGNLVAFYVSSEFNNTFLLVAMLLLLNLFPNGILSRAGGMRV